MGDYANPASTGPLILRAINSVDLVIPRWRTTFSLFLSLFLPLPPVYPYILLKFILFLIRLRGHLVRDELQGSLERREIA